MVICAGCAQKSPPGYYVHVSGDKEIDTHVDAAQAALDDLDVEAANRSMTFAKQRLDYLSGVGFSVRSIDHYQKKLKTLSAKIEEVKKGGGRFARVSFFVGYDPETMETARDAVKLGDLKLRMARAPYNRRVEVKHLIVYYTQGPGRRQYEIYLRRMAKYKNHIRRVFGIYGLPQELICVAMIESAGDPTRVSTAGAAGLWQFIPETGRRYGLIVGDTVDQRFDPYLETYAAAKYLKFLLNRFGNDVEAALASYNCGEGFIDRVLSDGNLLSIWHAPYHGKQGVDEDLPSIPKETYDYIARWLAVAVIYQNLKKYGFAEPVTPEDPFMLVKVSGSVDCAGFANDMGIHPETLVGLNPSLKTGRTPEGQNTVVRLPPADPVNYVNRLRDSRQYRISFVYRHKVTGYQTLRAIAQSYGVSPARISDVNDLGEKTRLEAGLVISIPTTAGNIKAAAAAKENVRYWRNLKGTLWDDHK